jgi:hypothetical protein
MYLFTEDDCRIYLVPDERGASDAYEAYSLIATRAGRTVWREGVRKDRSAMRPEYRTPIETALTKVAGEES